MKRLLLPLFLLCVPLLTANEADVTAMEKKWAAALLAKDTAALGKIYSDDLVYTHSSAQVDSKEVFLKNVGSGNSRYEAMDLKEIKVRMFGNTAVVHTLAHIRNVNTVTKNVTDGDLRLLHIYVKKGKDWQMVAHQSVRVPAQ